MSKVAGENAIKAIKSWTEGKTGDLSSLATSAKTNLVAAVNEVDAESAKIEVTSTDPGEGTSLEAGHFIAVTGQSEFLDLFYPVGSYYETSNTSFDPNTAWGGTWVEDTAGRILVAQDSGTFDTVGDTGGSEKHTHTIDARLRMWFGAAGGETSKAFDIIDENGNGGTMTQNTGLLSRTTVARNQALLSGTTSFTHDGFGQKIISKTYSNSSLQPYVVIKRWHRTA